METKYADCTTKKAKIAFIKKMVATNKAWALRALIRIYELQTSDEQDSGYTKYHNKVGFNGTDADILSDFARQVNEKRFVGSIKQMNIIHKKMPKYARQLMEIADSEKKPQQADLTEQMRDPNEEERRVA